MLELIFMLLIIIGGIPDAIMFPFAIPIELGGNVDPLVEPFVELAEVEVEPLGVNAGPPDKVIGGDEAGMRPDP